MERFQWIIPVIFVLGGFLSGLIFDRIIFNRLKKLAIKRQFPGQDIVFSSLHKMPILWFFLAGVYGAVLSLQLNPTLSEILQKLLTAAFLYSATLVLARLAAGFMTLYGQRTEGLSASLLSNLARILVIVLGILAILQAVGINITPILATLGIGGLAVALAFQDTLSNLFAGLYLIISRQVRTGDYVKLETGEEGYVTDIGWRHTNIRELVNNLIIVPNTKLASAIFKNYHLPAKQITLQIPVGVSYNSDLEQVEAVTVEVAKEVMQKVCSGVTNFEPFICYQSFGDFSINLTVFLCASEFLEQRKVRHEFIKMLHQRYRQEGIEIPFPIRNVYLKQQQD
ncbi:MAG: mechanosensitive ion channel family protein [Kastovskya adunca ATA6-11-RM4]|jgi:small-conductance mechanosensitive channel|nr:mechanosensitive ion channel family protein [Kastovskya adunca ATA6-11-RM4]